MTKLSEKLAYMLRDAASTVGYADAVGYIEEELTAPQHKELTAFIAWLLANKRTYGANVQQVFAEYKAASAQPKWEAGDACPKCEGEMECLMSPIPHLKGAGKWQCKDCGHIQHI